MLCVSAHTPVKFIRYRHLLSLILEYLGILTSFASENFRHFLTLLLYTGASTGGGVEAACVQFGLEGNNSRLGWLPYELCVKSMYNL